MARTGQYLAYPIEKVAIFGRRALDSVDEGWGEAARLGKNGNQGPRGRGLPRPAATRQVRATFLGRPPLAPFARAAAAFAGEVLLPAARASSRVIQRRAPNMPATSAGT